MSNVFEQGKGTSIAVVCLAGLNIGVHLMNNMHLLNAMVNYRKFYARVMRVNTWWARVMMVVLYITPLTLQICFLSVILDVYSGTNPPSVVNSALWGRALISAVVDLVVSYYVYILAGADIAFLRGVFAKWWGFINFTQFLLTLLLQGLYVDYQGPGNLVTWSTVASVFSSITNAALYTYLHYRYRRFKFFRTIRRFLSNMLWILYLYSFVGILFASLVVVQPYTNKLPDFYYYEGTLPYVIVQALVIFVILENFFPFVSPFETNDGDESSSGHDSSKRGAKSGSLNQKDRDAEKGIHSTEVSSNHNGRSIQVAESNAQLQPSIHIERADILEESGVYVGG